MQYDQIALRARADGERVLGPDGHPVAPEPTPGKYRRAGPVHERLGEPLAGRDR